MSHLNPLPCREFRPNKLDLCKPRCCSCYVLISCSGHSILSHMQLLDAARRPPTWLSAAFSVAVGFARVMLTDAMSGPPLVSHGACGRLLLAAGEPWLVTSGEPW